MKHPERLGKYAITEVLGEGAMGVVYKAFDAGIGRPVALKTIRKSLSRAPGDDDSLSERFLNEARAVGRLNHPGIVAIYELGEDQGTAFIAMEYVEGQDLSQILAATPVLPEALALRVIHQLLDALEYAHQHGVWHRDIKPANLIITPTGQLKVTDFGIAKIESASLTQVVSTIGTPGYMAPEQYIGEVFDHRVDIFAAGVLLYRMLAGQAPFSGSAETVMYKIMNSDPPPLGQFLPMDLASSYEPIVAGALRKDPARRYASASAFRQALRHRAGSESGANADPDIDADATTVVRSTRAGGERPLANPLGGPSPSAVPTHTTHAKALIGWEGDTLAAVGEALARFVGPMARVLVRRAATKCSDLPTLMTALSGDIPNGDDKAKFRSLVQQAVRPGTAGTSAGTGTRATPTTASATAYADTEIIAQPLSAPLLELANLLMARHMGPIAKIIVKKSAAKAASPAQFVALLAQEVPDGPKRVQLVAELQARC